MMNISIFGSASPKFIYDLGGSNEATVTLNYWVPDADEPEAREVVQESELEADRTIIDRGDFWTFSGRINLFKYNTPAAIKSKFEEIYKYHKKEVVLYKHSDGAPFVDASGNNVLFYLTVTPANLTTLDYRDILLLNFRSLKGVNFTNNFAATPQLSEIIINTITQ